MYYDDASDFAELAAAVVLATNRGDRPLIAEQRGASDRVQRVLRKSAADIGLLTDGSNEGWPGGLVDFAVATDGLISSLRGVGAFDRILADGNFLRVPMNTYLGFVSVGAVGALVAEAALKPAADMVLEFPRLPVLKASAFVVASLEVWKSISAGAKALITNELRRAVAKATDKSFIAAMIAGASSTGSAGATAANMRTNFATLYAAVTPTQDSKLYFISTPATATKIGGLSDASGGYAFPLVGPLGGEVSGVVYLVSDSVPAGDLLLVDASSVAADSGVVTLDQAGQASVDMGDGNLISLWQNNLRAARVERSFSYAKARSGAAAVITSV